MELRIDRSVLRHLCATSSLHGNCRRHQQWCKIQEVSHRYSKSGPKYLCQLHTVKLDWLQIYRGVSPFYFDEIAV